MVIARSAAFINDSEHLDVLKGARKVVDTLRPRIVIACTLDKIPYPSKSYVWTYIQGYMSFNNRSYNANENEPSWNQ